VNEIGFPNHSIEFTSVTTYQKPAIVKKHCETNSLWSKFMAGLPRSLSNQTTVFCDFDGPVVDVSDRYYSTYQLALADTQLFDREFSQPRQSAHTQHILTKSQFWQMKQNRTPDREIAQRSGLTDETIDFFLSRVVDIVNQPNLLEQDQIQPGASRALNLLRAEGAKLILVTLRDRDEATGILEQHGLRHLFTDIYGTDDSKAAYQNYAQLKTILLERAIHDHSTQVDRQNAWMIGDTEADILAGQAMGIATIGLTCGIRSRQQLSQLQPTLIETDLLAAADYLVGINCCNVCV
jgi:phosphoglycolate phosphatase